jgi:hypothetical protein
MQLTPDGDLPCRPPQFRAGCTRAGTRVGSRRAGCAGVCRWGQDGLVSTTSALTARTELVRRLVRARMTFDSKCSAGNVGILRTVADPAPAPGHLSVPRTEKRCTTPRTRDGSFVAGRQSPVLHGGCGRRRAAAGSAKARTAAWYKCRDGNTSVVQLWIARAEPRSQCALVHAFWDGLHPPRRHRDPKT